MKDFYKQIAVLILSVLALLMFLWVLGYTLLHARVITIPYEAEHLAVEDRVLLEELLSIPVEDALRVGILTPGDQIDTESPGIQFVLSFNRFLKKRRQVVREGGVDVFQNRLDYQEILAFIKAEEDWERFEEMVEGGYQEFRRARKAWRRVKQAHERERRGW